jgi:hypothetical protein
VFISFSPWLEFLFFQDISLIAPMLAILSHDVSEIGARMGFCYSVIGMHLFFDEDEVVRYN